jgi:hypothetical protein
MIPENNIRFTKKSILRRFANKPANTIDNISEKMIKNEPTMVCLVSITSPASFLLSRLIANI